MTAGASPVPHAAPTVASISTYGTEYRLDIQGMRAIAVVLVLVFHFGIPLFPGGFIGVDVFFVLSGFLITGIMIRELQRTSRFRVSRFYAKRILRIIPAATIVLVATVAATVAWVPVTEWKSIAAETLGSAVYIVNWQLAATTNYLNAEGMPSPLQHFWSLAVEEQFYLIWPAVFLIVLLLSQFCVRRQSPAQVSHSVITTALRWLPIVMLVGVLLSFGSALIAMERWPAAAYFITPTRMWEIGIGSLLAFSVPILRTLPRSVKRLLTLVGLASIVGAAMTYTTSTPFPGATALLPVLGAAAMLAGGLAAHPDELRYPILGHPIMVWLGNISYALYLWHWPVLIVAEAHFGDLSIGAKLLLGGIAVFLAALSTRYIEQPIRRAAVFRKRTSRAFLLGIAAILVSVVAGIGLWLAVTVKAHAPEGPNALGAAAISPDGEVPEVDTLPSNLTPNLLTVSDDNPGLYAAGCHLEPAETDIRDCSFGSEDGPLVLLVGDSHAAQWFPALTELAETRGFQLVPMTKSSCPLVTTAIELTGKDREYGECAEWNAAVQVYIEKTQPSLVITSALEIYSAIDSHTTNALSVGFGQSWTAITSQDIPLLVLADTPYMSGNVPECLAQNSANVAACATESGIAFENAGPLLH